MDRTRRTLAPGTAVVITGASSGIRRAVALAFARRSARPVPSARSATAVRPLKRAVDPGARLTPRAHAPMPPLVRGLARRRTQHPSPDAPGTAPVTIGTPYDPSGATVAVSGDRHAGTRTAARRASALAAAACFIGARSSAGVRSGVRTPPHTGSPHAGSRTPARLHPRRR